MQAPHSLRRSPRFTSPAGFTKQDGQKFSFDDIDFPVDMDGNSLEFVSNTLGLIFIMQWIFDADVWLLG